MVPERFKKWADEVRAQAIVRKLGRKLWLMPFPVNFAADLENCRKVAPNGYIRPPTRNWTYGWIR